MKKKDFEYGTSTDEQVEKNNLSLWIKNKAKYTKFREDYPKAAIIADLKDLVEKRIEEWIANAPGKDLAG
jgi:hypothetical protein